MKRCFWVDEKSEIYVKYHDEEWGVPNHNDRDLFELLILEGFQAGLSWITVLKKREAFRKAFDNFDVTKVSEYDEEKINALLIPVKTELSDMVSKDLKKRGMKYTGSVIIYSYLQAIGVVNDHDINCYKY